VGYEDAYEQITTTAPVAATVCVTDSVITYIFNPSINKTVCLLCLRR